MLAAVKGVLHGNTVVIENEDLAAYQGSEVIVTLLDNSFKKKSDLQTLKEIQEMFDDDKGWMSEQEMLEDMARFRREHGAT